VLSKAHICTQKQQAKIKPSKEWRMHTKEIPGRALVIAIVLAAFAIPGFSQTAAETPRKATVSNDEVSILKQEVSEQQKQIQELRTAISEMKQRLDGSMSNTPAATPQAPNVGQVASATPVIPKSLMVPENASGTLATATPSLMPVANPQKKNLEETSPLQLRVGNAYITPVGFMDFTSVWRSTDGGSGIGTNFASIPYGNTFQDNLSEFRLSMQNSRIGFRVDAMVHDAHVIGYMESDFLGNNPGNVAVSSNSNTMRSRLYWVDARKGNWELLGGQTWSLLTPGRSGISPLPGDLFFTQNIDVNYQLGLVWGRIPELRFVYHPSKKAALAIALDSPEQYVGGSAGGGLVTFPAALATTYVNELNTGGNTLGVPNVAPDVIAKLAFDPAKRLHFEVGGVVREFKVWNPTTKTTASSAGGGGFLNLNFELFKGFRMLTNNFVSDGGGRYIFGQAPDLIARADGSPSPIHADSTASGFEYTNKNTLLYAYYGGLYIGRNVAIDTSGKPVGYGYAGSPAGQNRAIQEGTFGFNQTLWKDAKFGALNFMGQYSYLTRNPWSVASGQPTNASLNMVFFNLRYSLPGSAPAMK
jgi:hypothetical protein